MKRRVEEDQRRLRKDDQDREMREKVENSGETNGEYNVERKSAAN